MEQFVKMSKSVLENNEMNSNEKIIFSLLYDRMKSSAKRPNFYDKKMNHYYVIYTINEMAKYLKLSRNTVINAYKNLEALGYIIKKKQFNGPSKIFIPSFKDESLESKPSEVKNSNSNQNNFNHKNKYTSDTLVTEQIKKQKISNQFKDDNLDALGNALKEKGGLSKRVISVIKRYSFGSKRKLYQYASLIFKAKKVGYNQAISYNQTNPNNYAAFRFETNEYLQEQFEFKLKDIIINARDKAINFYGYIFSSLVDWFTTKADQFLQENGPKIDLKNSRIPIFKIGGNN
ncbi:hypothetical protein WR164_16030 [Philodulcilactobacillus myokoensis]|uniref:Replication initiator protein A C-terminal domain-containing protein n=1 Tax=Philodulcilactobacillus myokoensis TaxID=2929573 RepID=A0A9W6B564_9LACO|nr:replication initiator protein A [Philodulcilactobacillus myokoensis]GLB47624.1 hypothetical protein WR164_16030 [Philodulcilactobacillus myokoensis]